MSYFKGKFDWDDINLEKSYGSWSAYGRSKVSNILFTNELARKLEGSGVTVNAGLFSSPNFY